MKLILDHYPVKSLSEITHNGKSARQIPFFLLLGRLKTLEELEEYFRKQSPEPYAYFALACGLFRCPLYRSLSPDASYSYSEKQLEVILREFLRRRLKLNNATDEATVLLPFQFRALIGDFSPDRETFERYVIHTVSGDLNSRKVNTSIQIQYERSEDPINDIQLLGKRSTPPNKSNAKSNEDAPGSKQWVGSTTETMDNVKQFGNAPKGADKPQVASNPNMKYVPAPPIQEYVEPRGSGTERGSTTEYGSGTESSAGQGR